MVGWIDTQAPNAQANSNFQNTFWYVNGTIPVSGGNTTLYRHVIIIGVIKA